MLFDDVIIPDGFVSSELQTNNFAVQGGNPAAFLSGINQPCGVYTNRSGRERHHLAILLRRLVPCALANAYSGNVIARIERICTPAINTAIRSGETSDAWPSGCSEAQARDFTTNSSSRIHRITNIIFRDADGNAKHFKYTGTDGQSFQDDSYRFYTEDADFLQFRSTAKPRGGFDGGAMLRLMDMFDEDERKR